MWPSETFRQLKIHHNAFAAGALPRTPLGELTTLPKPPRRLGRGPTQDAFGVPGRRLWHLHSLPRY